MFDKEMVLDSLQNIRSALQMIQELLSPSNAPMTSSLLQVVHFAWMQSA